MRPDSVPVVLPLIEVTDAYPTRVSVVPVTLDNGHHHGLRTNALCTGTPVPVGGSLAASLVLDPALASPRQVCPYSRSFLLRKPLCPANHPFTRFRSWLSAAAPAFSA